MNSSIHIAICGHIDHGKSTLIGRLLIDTKSLPEDRLAELNKIGKAFGEETQLAYLSDQLKEERERNITIETTQHVIKTSSSAQHILIDTPGHVEFIANMLTGASHAQAAIILLDITEGIQEQTRRHIYLLKFLSIQQMIVLVNKMDLVTFDQGKFNAVNSELIALFKQLELPQPVIIPASAKFADHITRRSKTMPWFKGPTLLKALRKLGKSEHPNLSRLRLPVQDLYETPQGPLIAGRIISGQLTLQQKVLVRPANQMTNIQTIHVFNENRRRATTGENIALKLKPPISIRRGDVICDVENTQPNVKRFLGRMIWLNPAPLATGESIRIRCATQSITAKATQITAKMNSATFLPIHTDEKLLKHNETALVQFELEQPAVFEQFSQCPELGRFTIENTTQILGAGRVEAL